MRGRPCCPRCGYDLRGVTSAWTDACPLDSRCTECGLMIHWPDVLSPKRRVPAWNVECARTPWHVPRTCVRTLWRTMRPWRFWTELKMTHEVRANRLAVYVVFLLAFVYGAFAVSQACAVLFSTSGPPSKVLFAAGYAAALPWSWDPPDYYYVTQGVAIPQRRPIGFTVSEPPPPLELTRRFTRGAFDAVNVRNLLFGFRATNPWSGGFENIIGLILFSMIPVLTTPLGMIALPQSRRKAKVLPRHIVRVTVYSLVLVPVALVYAILRFTFADSWINLCSDWRLVGWWLVPVFLMIWWTAAIRRYLRMPHAPGVAAAIVVIGILIGPALGLVIWTGGAMVGVWR
ncbi:MAG: hypothetical protein GY715_04425 [Planctomycetes bacterium]|nr:hypothetical protein [Planctomycetota bacterium]